MTTSLLEGLPEVIILIRTGPVERRAGVAFGGRLDGCQYPQVSGSSSSS